MASQQAKPATSMGAMFDIVGIEIGNRGRSCLQHRVCGTQVVEGLEVRLKREVIKVDGLDEVVISVYMEGDGRSCRVGFTPRHLTDNSDYDGALATIVEVYSRHDMTSTVKRKKVNHNHGFAVAALVVGAPKKVAMKKKRAVKQKKPQPPPSAASPAKKKQKKEENNITKTK